MTNAWPANPSDAPDRPLFRYVDAMNHGRFDWIRHGVFAPDAILEIPGLPPAKGIDDIVGLLEPLARELEFWLQLVHSHDVIVDGDRAIGRAYISERGRLKSGSDFEVFGVYDDDYQKLAGGWRFTHRRFRLQYRRQSDPAGRFYRLDGDRPVR